MKHRYKINIENKKKYSTTIVICLFLVLLLFYLRQQYYIIKMEKDITVLYEQIRSIQNENKELVLEIQKLTSAQRLLEYAKKLNFVPVTQNNIEIVE